MLTAMGYVVLSGLVLWIVVMLLYVIIWTIQWNKRDREMRRIYDSKRRK